MSFDIIHDAEKGIAAIIDPEVGRAIGPIGFGESAAEVLEKFAGTFVGDITKHPPSEVERKFEDFILKLSDIQDAVEGTAAEGASAAPGADAAAPSELGTAVEGTAGATAKPSPEAEAGPTPGTSPSPVAGADTTAPSDTDEGGPVTTPKAGNQICPTCDGWRTIPQGEAEVECPTCKGTGEVLAEQAEPGTGPGQAPA
jgi:hypothetical protein